MLQDAFEGELRRAVYEKAADLVALKFDAEGVPLGRRDRKRLLRALEKGKLESFSVRGWRWWDTREVSITITDEEIETFEGEVQGLFDSLGEVLPEVVEATTLSMVEWINDRGRKDLKKRQRESDGFRKRVEATWKEPFDLLDLVIHLATDVGMNVGGSALKAEAPDQQLASLLLRLHGRGLRIAREVLTLMRGGFADAALARWRTLHEVTVVAAFVADHGEASAERYVAHQAVANYKGARRYQEDAPRLGFQEFTAQAMQDITDARDRVIQKYGREFRGDYGWAVEYLDGAPANFAEIEKAVSFDHFRSLHRWASQEVHAGVKALYTELAAPGTEVILIGPTNTGFADPGQNTCISLMVVTSLLLQLGPSIDSLVMSRTMSHFVDRAIDEFITVQTAVESSDA
jgi:hypothetical protein